MKNRPFTQADMVFILNNISQISSNIVQEPLNENHNEGQELQCRIVFKESIKKVREEGKIVIIPFKKGFSDWSSIILFSFDSIDIKAIFCNYANQQSAHFYFYNILKSFLCLRIENFPIVPRNYHDNNGLVTAINTKHIIQLKGNYNNIKILPIIEEQKIIKWRDRLPNVNFNYREYNQRYEELMAIYREVQKNYIAKKNTLFGTQTPLGAFAFGNPTKIDMKPSCPRLQALNTFAKLFSSKPYTAIIESLGNESKLLISCADGTTFPSDEDKEVKEKAKEIVVVFKNIVNTNGEIPESLKRELFTIMYRSGFKNEMLLQLFDYEAGDNLQINQNNPQRKKYFSSLSDFNQQADLSSSDFSYFIRDNFVKIFTQEELLNLKLYPDIFEKFEKCEIKLIRTKRNQVEAVLGIHVELKGINEIRKEDPQAKEFNIGLANSHPLHNQESINFPPPYSCASCTAEIEVLESIENINKLTIYVSAISKDNFPPRVLNPSSNVNSDPEVFIAYLKKIVEFAQEKSIENLPDKRKEAFRNRIKDLENAYRKLEQALTLLEQNRTNLQILKDYINKEALLIQNLPYPQALLNLENLLNVPLNVQGKIQQGMHLTSPQPKVAILKQENQEVHHILQLHGRGRGIKVNIHQQPQNNLERDNILRSRGRGEGRGRGVF